jgi:transcriptional regulator with XRE-family HTH domain
MQHNEQLNLLIDKASSIAGNDSALARELGVSRQRISNWRHGQDTCTPEDQALIAEIAGMDAMTVLARAMVAKHEGTRKGEMLMRALGKTLAATGAAAGSAGAHAGELFGTIPALDGVGAMLAWLATMYIMLSSIVGTRSVQEGICQSNKKDCTPALDTAVHSATTHRSLAMLSGL